MDVLPCTGASISDLRLVRAERVGRYRASASLARRKTLSTGRRPGTALKSEAGLQLWKGRKNRDAFRVIDLSDRLLCHSPDRRRFLSALSDLHQVQKSTDEVAYE